jgi:urease accessory protein UreE
MKITKLLSPESAPAPTLLARADKIVLTYADRLQLPQAFETVAGKKLENSLGETRPLEVGDVLVDERGHFYVIQAGVETILKVTGDMDLMQQAVYALTARGIRVAQAEGGFALPLNAQLKELLKSVGLTVEEVESAFEPVPLPRRHGGCGCGCGSSFVTTSTAAGCSSFVGSSFGCGSAFFAFGWRGLRSPATTSQPSLRVKNCFPFSSRPSVNMLAYFAINFAPFSFLSDWSDT